MTEHVRIAALTSAQPENEQSVPTKIYFTVDSSLIRELGERLVGKPYVALAELIKNSYDADAKQVDIEFTGDSIVVSDDGVGMTFEEFRDRWMRIGSPHKEREKESPTLHRPLTGSKGVGRLATQLLAEQLEVITYARGRADSAIRVEVNWAEAATAGELTQALARYDEIEPKMSFAGGARAGTSVTLGGLRHEWEASDFEELARQVWSLQPPFRLVQPTDAGSQFQINLRSSDESITAAFEGQLSRILDLWDARLIGAVTDPASKDNDYAATVSLTLEQKGGNYETVTYPIEKCLISSLDFELRIFKLEGKQAHGIKVGEAREYFREYGGAHIYDAGFRIPLGGPEADWLRLEFDHAHRLSRSRLLPRELNVANGLNFLPTNSRLWGVVNIDTAVERRRASDRSTGIRDALEIQISRDRLVHNAAFDQLRDAVRWALDFYSQRTAWAQLQATLATAPVTPAEFGERFSAVLDRHEASIPARARRDIEAELDDALNLVRSSALKRRGESSLLGSLATAGISALAIDHQMRQQFNALEDLAAELVDLGGEGLELRTVGSDVATWVENTRALLAIFAPLREEADRTDDKRFEVKELVCDLADRLGGLLRGVQLDLDCLDGGLKLPLSSFAAWNAVFQNLFMNSANAMLDSPRKTLQVASEIDGRRASVLVSDTGVGVDLAGADELFEPFHRRLDISSERRQLGLGGMGLGLTIVRLLADSASATVRFVTPRSGFSTTCELAWHEQERRA